MSQSKFVELEPQEQIATFAAGCFWDVQHRFERVAGVVDTRAGFVNVAKPRNPDAEAVQVKFDTSQVSFKDLLDIFWTMHDPTHATMQKTLYRSGIYTHSEDQRADAHLAKKTKALDQDIVTEIEPIGSFYPAIESHQRYRQKRGSM
ncbi:Aste57867_12286 [Aphanomyces stellatus]|uniref:peptide-methionine (S)-S-oxide reductase n=1 Tax=Aphanomyces stellatus TaxID=120398 RepID=A0A485KVY9_9STRA|nr:hypothetical protein As57867_012241 [Aphanomyces stellatus]VFT89139.1 Aste57867_12286 [Aphanomyces stellatus]